MEAWYVYSTKEVPYVYWSCSKQDWVPWVAGDEAEAFFTKTSAEEVAFNLAAQMPLLAQKIGVMRRA